MATTPLSLGTHWEDFIRREIATGRYSSASEVVRAALREYEDKGRRLAALRTHLTEGIEQANRGEFVDDFDIETIISNAGIRAPDLAGGMAERRLPAGQGNRVDPIR